MGAESTESLSRQDPSTNIGESFFKQREYNKLAQKILESDVKFSIPIAVVGGPTSGKKTLVSRECTIGEDYMDKNLIKGVGIQTFVRI